MAKKPPLQLVPNLPGTGPEPPRTLGDHGRRLWNRVCTEYDIADVAGIEMLAQCCAALDRAEALRAGIDQDGEVIRTRGQIKDHPALKHELAARAFVVRTLSRLGLNFEPLRSGPGRPPS
jgi:phage terminase small subunit